MAWTYNGNRIYVLDKDSTPVSQMIARIQPLSGGTSEQVFGYESAIFKISCKVVGDTILDALIALGKTGLAYTLAGSSGFSKTLYLKSVNYKQDNTVWQSIDIAQDQLTPVYSVVLELYE